MMDNLKTLSNNYMIPSIKNYSKKRESIMNIDLSTMLLLQLLKEMEVSYGLVRIMMEMLCLI